MKLVNYFLGIQCVLQVAGILSTLTGKDKQLGKQFTLSCTGMDYSFRQQRLLQNDDDSTQNSFKGLYPEGQEVLYSYSAVVTTGTKTPAQFVSQFNLTGNIKVQGFKDKARVQFLNLKFVMYSGDIVAERKLKISKLPENTTKTLYEPFDIFYKDGQVLRLEMSAETPPWSKSIKKALSGILQLNLPKVNTDKFSSFVSTEQSIHGRCAVLNSVKPYKNKLHINKFYSTNDCLKDDAEWANVETEPGCLNVEPLSNDLKSTSQKTYRVTPYGEDTLLIREVFTEGKTYRFLGENSNSSHYITVSQKLQLVSMNGITRVTEIANPEETSTLEFDATQFETFKFSTNEDLNKVVKKVYHLLPAVRTELEGKNSLLSDQVNLQESHLVPLLITYLRKLDYDWLYRLYNYLDINKDSLSIDMLLKILPLVGSKDSALLLVQLVKDGKIVNHEAELLVSSLPFHLRQVSEEHLTNFEELLNLPASTNNDVKNAAVLSFATLVYKTCKVNKCKPDTINKYTLHYIENSKEYLNQLVYCAGLSNLHLEDIVDFMEPVIFGEEPVSSETVQVFGLRAVFPIIAGNPEKAYEIFWPVIVNQDNNLELRATALALLMEAQEEASIFTQLHQTMIADEYKSHLYNIYYKLIKSYSEDTQICHLNRKRIAKQIMKAMRTPVISEIASSYYKFSVFDGELQVLTTVNRVIEDGISAYISYSSIYNKNPINYYSIYIKFRGIKIEFLNDILQTIINPSRAGETLKEFIEHNRLGLPESFQLELILFAQQQVVSLRNYDKSNIEYLMKDLINVFQAQNLSKYSFLYASSFFNMETFFVTDIGFPGVLSLDFPNILIFRSGKAVDDPNHVNLDASFDLRYWSQGSTVLKVRNTVVDIWQGIMNSHTIRFIYPLRFEVNLKDQLYVNFKPDSLPENNLSGFKWHTQTDIFTVTNSDNYDALSTTCSECKPLSSVKQKIAPTVENQFDNHIYSVNNKIYDCEDDGTTNLLKAIPGFDSPSIFYTLGTILSGGRFIENYLLELPISGSCGYSTVYTLNQECTLCVKSAQENNNITLMIGTSGISEEQCKSDMTISLVLAASSEDSSYDKDQLMGECKRKLAEGFETKLKEQFKGKVGTCGAGKSNGLAENLEWCEKEMKPQIMSCVQTEMKKSSQEKVLKINVKFNEIPQDIEEAILLLTKGTELRAESLSNDEPGITLIVNLSPSLPDHQDLVCPHIG